MDDVTRDPQDDPMPYGVDTIRLRISFPAAPEPQDYDDRVWWMRPLRGWTGGARWDAQRAEAPAGAEQGGGYADEGVAIPIASAAQQADAGSSLRATLDRVIAATSTEPPAVEAQGGVQYAQAEPPTENETTRRAGPGTPELSMDEVGRQTRYGNAFSDLRSLEPDNPKLAEPSLRATGAVPTEAEVEAFEQEYRMARRRALQQSNAPNRQGPADRDLRTTLLPDHLPPFRWATIDRPTMPGTITGEPDPKDPAATAFAKELGDAGNNVKFIPRLVVPGERTADMYIDGTKFEYKRVSDIRDQTSDGLSRGLAERIRDAKGQSPDIIIDARAQPGMTRDIAARGVRRAYGNDNLYGRKTQSVTVIIADGGVLYELRMPGF